MIDFTHPCLTLPLISVTGVITSLAGIAVIEGIMKRENKDALKRWLLLSLPFVGVLALCVAWLYWGTFVLLKGQEAGELSDAGAAGDTFGGLTSLFSGLAFAGLVVTLVFQRKELEQTRDVFLRQKFESTFFHLLNMYRGSAEGAEFSKNPLISHKETYRYHGGVQSLEECERKATGAFKHFLDRDSGALQASYFRLLWNCVRLLHRQEFLTCEDKLEFAKIVRSTLSADETLLLAIYGLSESGRKVGEKFIGRYKLIKYLRISDIEMYPFLVQSYGRAAFGDRYETVEGAMRRGMNRK